MSSLGKMATPRAQDVLSADCGPIPGRHTLTAVPPIPTEEYLRWRYLWQLSFQWLATSDRREKFEFTHAWSRGTCGPHNVITLHGLTMKECLNVLYNQLIAEWPDREAWQALLSAFSPVSRSPLYCFLHSHYLVL